MKINSHFALSMAVAASPDDSGLPGWLDELLKPGVSPGVFTTLKLSLVSLIIVLSGMLCIIQDSVRVWCFSRDRIMLLTSS